MTELNYADYISIQREIVEALNAYLPTLKDLPCDYVEVNDLLSSGPCMAIAFVPKAYETGADMVGRFREVTFQLNYKVACYTNNDKLEAFKVLEYLTEALKTLNILTQNDKINLGISGSASPVVIDFDETGEYKIFQALYTLNYKQLTRGF